MLLSGNVAVWLLDHRSRAKGHSRSSNDCFVHNNTYQSLTPLEKPEMRRFPVLRRLRRDTLGANMVEYIILVGVVALLAIVAFRFFNSSVKAKVQQQAGAVQAINGAE